MEMNDQLAVLAQRPAYLQAAQPTQNALGAGISVGFPTLSIKQSIFRVKQGDTETPLQDRHIDLVIVAANAHVSKTYYMKQWQPGDAEAPDCASSDGVTPDAGVPHRQADTCAACPQNQWGSKVSALGKQIKACSDGKRLVVLPAQQPEGALTLLTVPPASLAPLATYANLLASHSIDPSVVITRVEFDTAADYPRLKFSPIGFVSEQVAELIRGRQIDPMVQTILGPVKRAAPAPVAALPAGMAQAPAYAQPVPQAAPVYAQPAPQPAVATTGYVAPAQPAQAAGFGAAQPAQAAGFGAAQPAPAAPPAAPAAGFGAPAAAAASAPAQNPTAGFGSVAQPAPTVPPPANGGEILPTTVAPSGLGAAVGAILEKFDDE